MTDRSKRPVVFIGDKKIDEIPDVEYPWCVKEEEKVKETFAGLRLNRLKSMGFRETRGCLVPTEFTAVGYFELDKAVYSNQVNLVIGREGGPQGQFSVAVWNLETVLVRQSYDVAEMTPSWMPNPENRLCRRTLEFPPSWVTHIIICYDCLTAVANHHIANIEVLELPVKRPAELTTPARPLENIGTQATPIGTHTHNFSFSSEAVPASLQDALADAVAQHLPPGSAVGFPASLPFTTQELQMRHVLRTTVRGPARYGGSIRVDVPGVRPDDFISIEPVTPGYIFRLIDVQIGGVILRVYAVDPQGSCVEVGEETNLTPVLLTITSIPGR